MAAPGVLVPAPLVVQVKPGEPCCPVVGFTAGLVGGPAPNTTPADGSSRQAPMVREANTCFISALPFKTMLRIGDSLETLRRACLQRSPYVRPSPPRGGEGAFAASKTPEGCELSGAILIFFHRPPSCPNMSGRGVQRRKCCFQAGWCGIIAVGT